MSTSHVQRGFVRSRHDVHATVANISCNRHQNFNSSARIHIAAAERVSVAVAAVAATRYHPVMGALSSSSPPLSCTQSHAIVWFKHDLRLDDHPGLHMAVNMEERNGQHRSVVPLLVFDPQVYSSVIDCKEMAYAFVDAVLSLKTSLRERGVELIVLCGSWDDVIPEFVQTLSSTQGDSAGCVIVTEHECDVTWARRMDDVRRKVHDDRVRVETWQCMIHKEYLKDSYPEWLSSTVISYDTPLDDSGLDFHSHACNDTGLLTADMSSGFDGEYVWNEIQSAMVSNQSKYRDEQPELDHTIQLCCANEERARQCLMDYITYNGYGGDIGSAIDTFDTDATVNGCFPAIFTRALYGTGTLSRRRVYHEAVRFLETQGESAPFEEEPLFRGPMSWLGWMLTSSGGDAARAQRVRKAKAALKSVELSDFHLGMAYRRQGAASFGATVEHVRWRGVLTDFLHASSGKHEGPAIVLVHGFGAFGEHWRRNVRELADKGFDVYAPTFPGYGRSEKMSLQYGQDLWRDFLADFISQVVKRPVVLAGNSIGGYISASVAADYPGMVKGLVLLNSAGQIQTDFCPIEYERKQIEHPRKPPPSIIVDGISTLLFKFLEADIENQLQRLYPTRPENADAWLGREIRRASKDPQALGVFRSVFYLPSPRPLNYLINELYGGPVLVLQGALDPLNDAPSRARQITDACPSAQCILLQAGHCPHDEVPDLVNAEIEAFAHKSLFKSVIDQSTTV